MKLYHKVFKNRPDLSIYLENQEPLVSYCDELLGRLSSSQNMEELCEAKKSILKDFRDIISSHTRLNIMESKLEIALIKQKERMRS